MQWLTVFDFQFHRTNAELARFGGRKDYDKFFIKNYLFNQFVNNLPILKKFREKAERENDQGVFEGFLSRILDNIQISVKNIHVRFEFPQHMFQKIDGIKNQDHYSW